MSANTPLSAAELAELRRLADEAQVPPGVQTYTVRMLIDRPNDDECVAAFQRWQAFVFACTPERVASLLSMVERGAADSARLDWLMKETPVRICYEDEGFESDRIELVSEHGSINDREFTSVGIGNDLRAAIDAARAATPRGGTEQQQDVG